MIVQAAIVTIVLVAYVAIVVIVRRDLRREVTGDRPSREGRARTRGDRDQTDRDDDTHRSSQNK